MADKQILTHYKVRKLQRTLYQQAKSNPTWKAWSLYADLCRKEFIEEAMSRILINKGGSGVDGYTVYAMEAEWETFRDSLQQELLEKTYKPSSVRCVVIPKANGGERRLGIPTVKDRVVQMILVLLLEPIFEADFHDESYGYRRGKKATDAVESISKSLYFGKPIAIEADLSQYFDTIDHQRLMKLIKGRVSDGAIHSLIKRFLESPVREEDNNGKHRTLPKNKKGVPQGGVISPLLANLYLDRLDKAVNSLDPSNVKMIRYADDFVILVKDGLEQLMLDRVQAWLQKAGLELNLEKTKITDTRSDKGGHQVGKVEFLGFELSERHSQTTGRRYIHCQASKKSQQRFRDKIRAELNHWSTWRSSEEMIKRVNRITRGWGNYYHYGNSCETFKQLNHWLRNRLRIWLAAKHKSLKVSKYKDYPDALLLEEMCLAQLEQKPHWV